MLDRIFVSGKQYIYICMLIHIYVCVLKIYMCVIYMNVLKISISCVSLGFCACKTSGVETNEPSDN